MSVAVFNSCFLLLVIKCPEDHNNEKTKHERRPSDSVVGRRVALHCDLLVHVIVPHETEPAFSLIPTGYLVTSYAAVDLRDHAILITLNGNVINVHTDLHHGATPPIDKKLVCPTGDLDLPSFGIPLQISVHFP